jgi:hypothetical protein
LTFSKQNRRNLDRNSKNGGKKVRFISEIVIIFMFLLFLSINISWAQGTGFTITDMKIEPSTVSPGGKALLSCRVNHAKGPMLIERVAAITSSEGWNISLPSLYDDGTHGDKVPNDGIFSLEVQAGDKAGDIKIVFSAVDKERNEIESEAIILIVK